MLVIYVDADGCPVKDEVIRVATRHGLRAVFVANTLVRLPSSGPFESVVVKGGLNEADDFIAERIEAGDIVITADIPLADRCLEKGAKALGTTGRPFTDKTIGGALASRELMQQLREMGTVTGGPRPFQKEDRSRFLAALETIIQKLKREEERRRRVRPS